VIALNLLPARHAWVSCDFGSAHACRYCTAYAPGQWRIGQRFAVYGRPVLAAMRTTKGPSRATRIPSCRMRRRWDYVKRSEPSRPGGRPEVDL